MKLFTAILFCAALCGCAQPSPSVTQQPVAQERTPARPSTVVKPPSSVTNVWLLGDGIHVGWWRAVFPADFNATNYIWGLLSSTNLDSTNWTHEEANFDYQWEGSAITFKIDHGIPGKFYRLYGETNSHQ